MNRFVQILVTVWFLMVGLVGAASAGLNVVTTTEDIASLVKVLAGDRVSVDTLTRGYQDTHFVQAKPSLMVRLNQADLLIYQGMELEVGWLPLLIQGARNPHIQLGQPGNLDLSLAVDPIEIPTTPLTRAMGDVHPFGNPHYPLGPNNIKPMVYMLTDHLAELDPEGRDTYRANRNRFVKQFEAKIKGWQMRMAPFKGAKVVTYHRTWSYLLKFFEMEYIGTVEPKPGIQPTPTHLAEIARKMKAQNVSVILQANYYQRRFSDLLAQKTGATVLVLPVAVGGVPEASDTIALFDYLVNQLEKALNRP